MAVLPYEANDLLDLVLFDSQKDRRVGLFEKAARAVQPRGPELVGEQSVDEGAGVLVVNHHDD